MLSQGQVGCIGEYESEESVSHSFFNPKLVGAWSSICKLIGVLAVLHNEGWQRLEQFENLFDRDRSLTMKISIIWFSCVLSIRNSRNDKVFQNEEIHIDKS